MPTDNTPSDNERSSSDKEAANMKLETVVQRFLEKCNELNENPSLWRFVEENTDFIAKNSDRNSAIEAKWAGIFGAAMKQRKIEVAKVNKKPDFGAVALKMLELARESSKDHSTSAVTATTKTPSHTSFSTSLSSADKARLAQTFQNLKEDRFWALHLDESLNVDQRVIEFARSCNYYHPSQSLILDLGDGNWETVFSGAQLDRIEAFGDPLFCDLPAEIIEILNEVSKLKTPMEAYKFARTLDFDPIKEPLKHWVSLELQKSSQLHFYGDFHLTSMLESDQQYEMWSFLKSMVNGNKIKAVGKEGSSKANADENNKKRCISAVDPAIHRKMGRKMDLLYESSGKELGCIEIGKDEDQTKEMKDGLLKMPIVMHDMLLQVAFSESLLRCVHVLGFVIVGGKVALLDMDSPGGYVTRIRRSKPLEYPTCSDDYVSRIVPLMKLALSGLAIMEKTRKAIVNTQSELQSLRSSNEWKLPTTFVPLSSRHSASTASSSKRQKSN